MKRKAKQKIDSIEKLAVLVAEGFEQVDKRFEQVDRRFERMETQLARITSELTDLHRRMDALEDQGARQAGYAKEIDHVLARIARIEKHLRLA